jgi:RNA polymerase sigma-70 factor (ECF subfamily)
MLRRARAQLARALPAEDEVAEPAEPGLRALLDRFAAAFENADAAALAELLREDVALEMPPMPAWFSGREAVTRFFATQVLAAPGLFRMVPTTANGQPAFAAYRRGRDGVYEAHAVQVLTVTAAGVARLVVFLDPALFRAFGLPQRSAAEAAPAGR